MKKFTILLKVLIAMTITANAQIPNGGFETWENVGNGEDPTDWSSFNEFSIYNFPTMSFKTLDSHTGTYALRIISDTATIPPPFGTNTLDTVMGMVILGTLDLQHPGIPYTNKPIFMNAWVKGTVQPTGSIFIITTLSKWNSTLQQRETLGQGIYAMTSSINIYTNINVPINYSSGLTPDTLVIQILTGEGGPTGHIMPNNELFIDDISLTIATDIENIREDKNNIKLFPNPASDFVTLNIDNKNNVDLTLNVYSVIGTLVKSEELKKNQQQVNVRDLDNGIYMVEIKSKKWSDKQKLIIKR